MAGRPKRGTGDAGRGVTSVTAPSPRPTIVSIQSQLVYGCAGNNAAVPLLERSGATVHAVPTVLMSNTPHYPTVAALDLEPAFVAELLERLLERAPPRSLDAILTGYVRAPDTVAVIAEFIDRVRAANPSASVLVDPVVGDADLGFFVPEAAAERVRDLLVPRADICTPNLFEGRFLCGLPDGDARAIGRRLTGAGPRTAVVTGIGLERASEVVETLAVTAGGTWSESAPVLALRPTGTGDVLAAAFLRGWLATRDVAHALSASTGIVRGLMQAAIDAGVAELEPARADVRSLIEGAPAGR